MKIQPLADRIVVKPLEAEEVTSGGIVLPDTAKDQPQRGKVEAVGPGKKTESGDVIAPALKKGDVVIYSKYGGTEIEEGGKKYLLIREEDILATVQ